MVPISPFATASAAATLYRCGAAGPRRSARRHAGGGRGSGPAPRVRSRSGPRRPPAGRPAQAAFAGRPTSARSHDVTPPAARSPPAATIRVCVSPGLPALMQSPMTSQSNRILGMRIMLRPATPGIAAMQPAWRPITSSAIAGRWLSAVWPADPRHPLHATADWNPNVLSVPGRSLSIVLAPPPPGRRPATAPGRFGASPSPPMQIRASMPSWLAPSAAFATTSGGIRGRPPFGERSVNRPRLEVPRIVPPGTTARRCPAQPEADGPAAAGAPRSRR